MRLRKWGLGRTRKDETSLERKIEVINQEMNGPNRDAGIVVMKNILRLHHNIFAKK
jgi:hypothetical protein